ncbi:hypothetical protein JQX13_38270 [Archangium violaceum]|uniref:hypothetical protein n=1 Tax=Archangium violaceum TaxID=83451 RepID=UPI00193C36FD|nr:hypothetical protein [Archangium violaceum]QRK05939.1 hypothetical protein JQX13_38270 [Archangium violaceum]
MRDKGFRRWTALGALMSTALLGGACEERRIENMPETGSEWEGTVNESQDLESFVEPPRNENQGRGGSGIIEEEVPSPRDEPMPQMDVKPRFQQEGYDTELEQQRELGPGGAIGTQPQGGRNTQPGSSERDEATPRQPAQGDER